MKLTPKHKYLILSNIRITGHIHNLILEGTEIYTGSKILKMMKDPEYINARVFGPKPVYCINTGRVYLFELNDLAIPSTPDLGDGADVDGHLVPLQLLIDLEPSKLPKYLDHRYETVRNLARYLIAHYQGEQQ